MQFNPLIPELLVRNLDRSVRFYRNLVGFEVKYERPEEKFAFLELEGSQLMLLQDNDGNHSRTGDLKYPRGQGVNFSIRTRHFDRIARSLEANGCPLRIPVREQWHRQDDVLHGEQQLWVTDPDGYLLRFVHSLGTKPVK